MKSGPHYESQKRQTQTQVKEYTFSLLFVCFLVNRAYYFSTFCGPFFSYVISSWQKRPEKTTLTGASFSKSSFSLVALERLQGRSRALPSFGASQNLLLTSCWLFSRCALLFFSRLLQISHKVGVRTSCSQLARQRFPLLVKGLLVVARSVLVNRKSELRLLMTDGG